MISSAYDSIQIFTSGRVFEISDNYMLLAVSLSLIPHVWIDDRIIRVKRE
jgi:hypothetical protein